MAFNWPTTRDYVAFVVAPLLPSAALFASTLFYVRQPITLLTFVQGLAGAFLIWGVPSYIGMIVFGLPLLNLFKRRAFSSFAAYGLLGSVSGLLTLAAVEGIYHFSGSHSTSWRHDFLDMLPLIFSIGLLEGLIFRWIAGKRSR